MANSWVRLNTNGLVRSEDELAAAEGLLHDQNGEWIIGFSRYLGNCTILDYKLCDIFNGVKLVLDQGFKRVLILTDSIEVVNIIQDGILGGSNSA